ncbi:YihY/virulence factor BrkB family protein [Halorubrum depositum]|uniref:YihY/virulence factor BrkB family protein n=1 Tax=Halorubrum depositum TaxID=2583992 RepID=UPI00119FCC13|nr:YihY/virulence factor BrkB family protein [Halorubrum depositum]
MNIQSAISRVKPVLSVFSEKNVTFLAGSIAYSAFVSLVPLVMFFLLAVSVLGAPELQQEIIDLATDNVSPSVGGVIEVMIEQQRDAGSGSTISASLIGVLTLVWGAIKVFRGLDTAFSAVYETTARESFLGQIKKSLVVLFTLTLGVVAMVGATTVVAFFSSVPYLGVLVPLLLVVGLCAAFFPMYYLFPDLDVAPRDVLPGTVVGAVGWAALQVLFQQYVSLSGGGGNLIASILLLVTWLYFSGVVLLLGATVNAVARDRAETGAEARVVDTEMTRGEAATYLRRLREDLTARFEGMRPTSEGAVAERNSPSGAISVTEWARETDEGTTHEVRLEWDADGDSEE